MKRHGQKPDPTRRLALLPWPQADGASANHDGNPGLHLGAALAAPKPSMAGVGGPTRDEIAAVAYQIYVAQGRPQGREREHWLEAEAKLGAVVLMTIDTEVSVSSGTGLSAKSGSVRIKTTV